MSELVIRHAYLPIGWSHGPLTVGKCGVLNHILAISQRWWSKRGKTPVFSAMTLDSFEQQM